MASNSETITFSTVDSTTAIESTTAIDSVTTIDSATVDSTPTPATVLTEPPKVEKKKSSKTSNKKKDSTPRGDSEKPKKTTKDKTAKDKSSKETEKEPAKKSKFSVNKQQTVKKQQTEKTVETPKEPSAYEKMFPAEFTVHGVKFTRLNLGNENILRALLHKYVGTLDGEENKSLCIAVNWEKEMLTKHGNRHSLYENETGIVPPCEFPANLDMLLIDHILRYSAKSIMAHSIYTEFASTTPFEIFNKRAKQGWFANVDAPAEFYEVDFSDAEDVDAALGFINLYSDSEENKNG